MAFNVFLPHPKDEKELRISSHALKKLCFKPEFENTVVFSFSEQRSEVFQSKLPCSLL